MYMKCEISAHPFIIIVKTQGSKSSLQSIKIPIKSPKDENTPSNEQNKIAM